MKRIGILAFTDRGRALAEAIKKNLAIGDEAIEYVEKPEEGKAKNFVRENFRSCDGWIFVGATGIAIRFIAPLIESKDVDPAVVVLDEGGKYAISLLSGHLGGANELAVQVAEAAGAEPVITTATDVNEKFAVDIWTKKMGCVIEDISKIKVISSRILKDEKIGFASDFPLAGTLPDFIDPEEKSAGIVVSLDGGKSCFEENLNAIPKIVTIGAGCRRGKEAEPFESFLLETLAEQEISLKAVERLVSIDLKKEEACMVEFGKKYGIPFETYTSEELGAVEGDFTPSAFVNSITGVDNVCERSALLGSQKGKLILRKTAKDGMTIAIAIRPWECSFDI